MSVAFFCILQYNLLMKVCTLCPRNCAVDRNKSVGFCKVGQLKISRVGIHHFEEPCISGDKGSGTIFFAGCNMRCCFCQNNCIANEANGVEISLETLEKIFLDVDQSCVHNLNLVSPSQYSDQIATVLAKIKHKLTKPVVYNTNSYESIQSLQKLDGIVDVYLPDLKYFDDHLAIKFSQTPNYFQVATKAIEEMRRQQPQQVFEAGLLKKGVLVRHLVLPDCVEDSKKVLDYLSKTPDIWVSLMAQYFPPATMPFEQLNKRVSKRQYDQVCDYFFAVGLKNGFSQSPTSAIKDFVPDFDQNLIKEYLTKLQ